MSDVMLQPGTWTRDEDSVFLRPSHCPDCHQYYFPPLSGCTKCFRQGLEQVSISGPGVLYSYSTIWVPRTGYPNPYTVAFVDFPELNMRVFGRLSSNGPLTLGEELELTCGVLHEQNGESVVSYMFQQMGG